MLNTHSDYIALFRGIANNHKLLAHTDNFFRVVNAMGPLGQALNIDEVMNAVRSTLITPVMLVESYDHGFMDNDGDNFWKKKEGAFIILDMPEDLTDPDSIEAVLTSTEALADDVLSYLKKYFRKGNIAAENSIDFSTITGEKVGPFALGYYGTRIAFHFGNSAHTALFYDATKWNTPL